MPLPTKTNVSRPLAWGYDALIEYGPNAADSLYLRLGVGPGRGMGFETVEPQQQGPNVAANPEDLRSESGQTFSRSQFSGGEGLDRAHRRDGTDRDWSRYWDSRGVDVTPGKPGEPEDLELLHSSSLLRAADVGGLNPETHMVRIGTALYGVISDPTQVDRTADPTASSPTWTVEDPHAGEGAANVRDLAVLGDEVYAAIGSNGIHKRSNAGTWSHWSDLGAIWCWGVKGRILAVNSAGTGLYEARSGSGSVLLHTLPAGTEWHDVVDAGGAILASAEDGYIYAFVEEEGELVLRGQTLIEGEQPTALGFAQGILFIGTAQQTTAGGYIGRLWRALFVGLRLRDAQVIRTWGDESETRNRAPHRIIATRESVITAVVEGGSETHAWRYHLETGGLSRDLVFGVSERVYALQVIDNRVFAILQNDGLWREDTTYVSSGYLIGPLADFFNAGKKAWVGARLSTGSVPTGTQVVLAYSTDPDAIEDPNHASWTDIVTATPSAPGDSSESAITGVESRFIAGKVTLTPDGSNAATPTVLAYAFRGLPLPTEDDFQIPVNISDRLELPFRKRLTVNGAGDAVYEKLQDIKGKAVTLTLLRPAEVLKGQLRSVSTPIQQLSQRGSPTVYCMLGLRGQRQ